MIELPATIKNEQGIHCRPSAVIIKAVRNFIGEIRIIAEVGECDPKSVMALMSLGLQQGTKIRIRVEGLDEEQCCRDLVALFETEFDFPPRPPGAPEPELEEDLT